MNSGVGESSRVANKELPRTVVLASHQVLRTQNCHEQWCWRVIRFCEQRIAMLARIAMNSGSGEPSGVTGDTFVNIVEQDSVNKSVQHRYKRNQSWPIMATPMHQDMTCENVLNVCVLEGGGGGMVLVDACVCVCSTWFRVTWSTPCPSC